MKVGTTEDEARECGVLLVNAGRQTYGSDKQRVAAKYQIKSRDRALSSTACHKHMVVVPSREVNPTTK
ncbi:MAG TPA: hypothetical protein VEB88_04190 [Candidatus Acidoferrales bacterium]|nr:hypothetical protein [Candidatus Acidoferrales bacterium]